MRKAIRIVALGIVAGLATTCQSDTESNQTTGGSGGTAQSGGGTAADYVNAHNVVRAAVVEPANYPGTWEPLPPVTWSDSIAATAQAWAEQLAANGCTLQHATGTGYGENLVMGSRLTPQGAVDVWSGEAKNYTYSSSYQFSDATGHYTQLVWRATTQIGCGSAACSNGNVIVCCRYSPPGNVLNQQPY
jgi:uncharacterized protein YkwD